MRLLLAGIAAEGILLGCRLMVGQRILVPYVRVRLLPAQPKNFKIPSRHSWKVVLNYPSALNVAPSSSGLGRRPLKAEVEGSNPFGATKRLQAGSIASSLFLFHVA